MRAVILAGGKGTRLAPFTTVLPKPLMPLGEHPILEIIVRQLKHYGITDLVLAVGYLGELLEAYFGDGRKYGVNISYSREEEPLGTAGPLALIDGLEDEPFLVMNGDLLTTLDYRTLFDNHLKAAAACTIAMYQRQVQISLGVMKFDHKHRLLDYIEKPTYNYHVSMGAYVFDPAVTKYIKRNEYLDFPDLIKMLMRDDRLVNVYPFDGYWLDIGRHDDYMQATEDFEAMRESLLFEEEEEEEVASC